MDPQNNQNQNNNQGQQNQNNAPMNTANNNTIMAVFSYLGPLVIVSYLTSKDNPFVKFHVKQGLAVFGLEVIIYILSTMMMSLWALLSIVNLVTLVLPIIGIINAVQGKQKELPLIGSFASGLSV